MIKICGFKGPKSVDLNDQNLWYREGPRTNTVRFRGRISCGGAGASHRGSLLKIENLPKRSPRPGVKNPQVFGTKSTDFGHLNPQILII